MFARFAHATSNTSPTAPSRITSIGHTLPTEASWSDLTTMPQPVFVAGYASASRVASAVVSVHDWSIDTSGFSRPSTLR